MLSLHKLTGTDRQAGRGAQVSIGMHAHPKTSIRRSIHSKDGFYVFPSMEGKLF